MLFKFAPEYLNRIKEDTGEVKEIDPTNCSKEDFRSLVAFIAVQSSQQISDLAAQVDVLRTEKDELKVEVDSLKTSVNSVVEENLKLRQEVDYVTTENRKKDDVIADVIARITVLEKFKTHYIKLVDQNKNKAISLERHSRSKNLRFILNRPESEGENTTEMINQELSKVGLQVKIEHSHRTGKQDDGGYPRQIIAAFLMRPDRLKVLGKRSELFANGVKCFEDLCYDDFQAKLRHSNYMKRLHSEGQRVKFERGCWYINKIKFSGNEDDDMDLYS